MAKEACTFEDFLERVDPDHLDFVTGLHGFLLEKGCKVKVELAKNGHVVSYTDGKTKKTVANYVFRKSGLIIRIYADHVGHYPDFLETLPPEMVKEIEKGSVCKRLLNPDDCNSRCTMGYDFTIGGTRYQKCRYGAFFFHICQGSMPFVRAFMENEMAARQ